MSKIKLSVVLVCMTVGLANVVKGQIYESEACFYANAGSGSVSTIVRFEGSRNLVWVKTCGFSRQNLAKSRNYYENETWTDGKYCVNKYEYDYSLSTSQREVYKRVPQEAIFATPNAFGGPLTCGCYISYTGKPVSCGKHGFRDGNTIYYVAFSKDKSSYIEWHIIKSDVDKIPQNKTTYTRVPKEDLLPKAANYDFLNE